MDEAIRLSQPRRAVAQLASALLSGSRGRPPQADRPDRIQKPMRWVYIIQNKDGKLYKGITSDLQQRIHYHNSNLGHWTKLKGPWKLVHSESYQTKREALVKERFYKSGKGRDLLKRMINQSSGRSAVG